MRNIWLLLTLILGLSALTVLHISLGVGLILLILLAGFLLYLWRGQKSYLACALIFLLSLFYSNHLLQRFEESYSAYRVTGEGIVSGPVGGGYELIQVRTDGGNFGKIRLYTSEILRPGVRVHFHGRTRMPEEDMNPGAFNQKHYDLSRGIGLRVQSNSLTQGDSGSRYIVFRERVSTSLREKISRYFPSREGSVLDALLLGGRADDAVSALFQANNLLHLLSISGLHIGIFMGFLTLLLKRFGLPLTLRKVLVEVLVFLYLFFVGFPVGGVRVFFMLSFINLSYFLNVPIHPLYSLSFASTFFLLKNPFVLLSRGFVLSFFAVASLYLLKDRIESALSLRNTTLRESLSGSLAVTVGILPLLLQYQGTFRPLSILLNVLYIPLYSFVLILGLIFLPLAYLFPLGAAFFAKAIYGLLLFGFDLLGALERVNFTFPLGHMDLVLFCLYYAIILAWVFGYTQKLSPRLTQLLLAQSICSYGLFLLFSAWSRPDFTLTQLYVGQGDCAHLQIGTYNALVDTSGSTFGEDPTARYIEPYLAYEGVGAIEDVFLSHFDGDHVGGVLTLGRSLPLHHLWASYRPVGNEWYEQIIRDVGPVQVIETFSQDKGQLHMEMIENPYNGEDENGHSMVLVFTYYGKKVFYGGDLPASQEEALMGKVGPVDILKLSHHGSRTSSSEVFLDTLRPQLVLISAGRNSWYGHPHQEVIDRIYERDITAFETAEVGAITIEGRRGNLYIRTHLPKMKMGEREVLAFFGSLLPAVLVCYYHTQEMKEGKYEY